MVRTRIAPSPTGPLHVGNARTALFNWLYARQHGGVFVVRVEDTDVARSDPRWERDALENFAWLGLNWDEGPILSSGQDWAPSEIGDYGPYRQSRRKDIYRKYLEELIEEGHVYECFCAVEELEAMRSAQLARGEAPRYVGRCRELGAADVAERRGRGAAAVLRFKVPAKKIVIDDLVRGKVEFDAALLGDIVIAKHLDYALYNFAAVIDDFTMEISHVIRGEDHLSNTPKQILFQEALQFPRPVYAHIPLLLGADRTKLSKRHGATAVTEYRTEGYLPEAALNFLALLGWHPEGNEELLSKEDLMRQFSLERVQKSAAVFTVEKLRWLNGEYIKKLSGEELAGRVLGEFAPALKETMGAISVDGVMTTMRTRAKTLRDIERYIRELSLPPAYSKDLLRWKDMSDAEVAASLRESRTLFAAVPEERFTQQTLEDLLMPKALEWGSGDRGKLLWPLRVALSGREKSEGPFELAKDLGKEETLRRLERALEILKEN